MDHDKKIATFYTNDGNQILVIPQLEGEFRFTGSKRLDQMIDEKASQLIRPYKLVIDYHIKLDKTLFIYDKSGNNIHYYRYTGMSDKPSIIKSIVEKQNAFPYKLGFDCQWLAENNVIIENKYNNTKPECVIC